MNILKTTELYILKGWILWYGKHITIKEKNHTNQYFLKDLFSYGYTESLLLLKGFL